MFWDRQIVDWGSLFLLGNGEQLFANALFRRKEGVDVVLLYHGAAVGGFGHICGSLGEVVVLVVGIGLFEGLRL